VQSIKGFQDTAGFMDRTDPYVSLKLGNDKKRTRTLDNAGGSAMFAETLTFADKQLFQNLMRVQVFMKPSTLNPQPSTLNPQPSTLNPQPSTLNPQLCILSPSPGTPSSKPQTLERAALREPDARAGV